MPKSAHEFRPLLQLSEDCSRNFRKGEALLLRKSHKPAKGSRRHVRYITDLGKVPEISRDERRRLQWVVNRYPFRANDYYLSLIDWDDPNDPIRQLVIPKMEELEAWGVLDPSSESAVTVARGVQHKYSSTALLLVTDACAGYCRYCFRKRFFMPGGSETSADVSEGLDYIASNTEVKDVLLTGGDPLMLNTDRLVSILEELRAIPHVNLIRIGSKMPAFNPWRILDDRLLVNALRRLSTADTRIYLMAHFDHPRELTDAAKAALDRFVNSGVVCLNQCPIVRGVNADPEVLGELFHELAAAGCSPYYIFQIRPTSGNAPFAVPIVESLEILEKAGERLSGLAKRARYVMSHASGKIEILGADNDHIYMHYHRAIDPADYGRFLAFHRDDSAYWLDDLEPACEKGVPTAQ